MKKIYLLSLGLLSACLSIGQNNSNQLHQSNRTATFVENSSISNLSANVNSIYGGQAGEHVCRSHELNEQHYLERGILNEYNQDYLNSTSHPYVPLEAKTPGANTISVIFHVVHNPNNPSENVSNAAIMAIFNEMQEDFNANNPDIGNARTGLGFNPANANINFCLATQDPSGTPLTEVGVVRVSTTEGWYDSDNGEENKMKSSATGGSQIWDRDDYLNIWICDISNGAGSGVAGYAYRPTPSFLPSSSIDGIVIDYNLGVNNPHVTSHEVGHYLGLDHTWGGSGGCTNDDGFADTPNTAGPSFNFSGSCSGSQQTCSGTETQYENFMDYANCTCMFTEDQADFMLSILNGIRSSLLLSPGCDPVDAPPVVEFHTDVAEPITIPVGAALQFTDESTNAPTSWSWNFGGGATNSTQQNPLVTFNTVGTYTVTLDATNAFGTGTLTKTAYVNVVAAASGTACDTLRNYALTDDLYDLGGSVGYIQGNDELSDGTNFYDVVEWAEPYAATATTEIRRLEMLITHISDAGGSVIFKVYQDNAGNPGTVLASETVALADLIEGFWNQVDFTTPASVTGNFWVGYELSYNATDTFALASTYELAPTPTNYTLMNVGGLVWMPVSDVFGDGGGNSLGVSFALDVLTSNGPAPVANIIFSEDEVCVGGDVTVNGSTSTNTTDYSWYQTDNTSTTIFSTSTSGSATFNFPSAGDYIIHLFADGSCQSDLSSVNITVDPVVSATVTPSATTCGQNNGTITVTSPTGGDGVNYEYSIDGVNYSTTSTFSNLASGTYTVYVRTSGDNCETTFNVNVATSTPFTAAISPNNTVCEGASATITASGGVSYQWYDGSTPIGVTASISVTPNATTQYTCVVSDGTCSSTEYVTVTVNQAPTVPTITASGATTICSGESVDLTSSYPTGNTWSTSSTSSSISVSTTGNYTVTYTDANGCTATSASTAVTVSPIPTISAGTVTDPTGCGSATGSIEVIGTGSGTVSWTGTATGNSGTVTLPYTISSLTAGSYNITLTNGAGCTSTTLNQSLSDPSAPTAPVITPNGATTFCAGSSVELTSSYTSGNAWSTGDGTNSITVTTSGTYTVTYTDGGGCSSSSAPIVVTVNSLPATPTITASGATSFCSGGSVDLTASQGSGLLWSTSETNQTITVTTAGNYTVTYTDGNGCSATSNSTNVTVNPNPTIASGTVTSPTSCGSSTGSIEVTGTGSGTVSWTGTATGNSGTVTLPYTISNLAAGSYDISFTNSSGCSSTILTESLSDPSAPAAPTVTTSGTTTICAGESVELTSSYTSGNTWSTGETTQSITVTTAGTYTVIHTSTAGCTSASSSDVVVVVNPLPVVTLLAIDDLCEYDAAITLTQGDPSGGTYSGTAVSGDSFDPAVAGVGTHTITYDYTDGNGCSSSAQTTITVSSCAGVEDVKGLDVKLYPNPTNSTVNIELSGSFSYKITDTKGAHVMSGDAFDKKQISLNQFEHGVYLIEVSNEQSTKLFRVIKQ